MSNEKHETVADNVSANHQFREVEKMIPHEEVDVSKMETTTPTREKSSCVDCPVNGVLPKNCALIWSQMPYNEGGAK